MERAGGDQITVHLREDRRHIQDDDVRLLRKHLRIPLNLEMAADEAITRFATKLRPDWACIVPERRQEVTTEGGLDVSPKNRKRIEKTIHSLHLAKVRVSLFIEPSVEAVIASHALGADAVEFHTGRYCLLTQTPGRTADKAAVLELERLHAATLMALELGLHPHAGHGFDYENVRPVVRLIPEIEEYNIGHSIVCRAAIVGMERAVKEMLWAFR